MRVQQLTVPASAQRRDRGSLSFPAIIGLARRLRPYLDAPDLVQTLRFRDLRRRFYTDLWHAAARNIGAELKPWRFGYLRVSRGGLTTVVNDTRVMIDDHLTLNVMGNKLLTYELLQEMDCRIPRHLAFSLATIDRAEEFRIRTGRAVVVKPASGTGGGRGITTGINTARGLRRASRIAARYCETLLVEEEIAGDSYRLLYLDGRLIDAVRRDPPVVVGDGRSTIRQLMKRETQRRLKDRPFTAMSPLTIDRDCRNRLSEQSLSPASRLAAGQTAIVKRVVNQNAASRNHSVREKVHREIADAGSRIVTALGVRFAGLDLMCSDIAAPWSSCEACLGEINTTPAIHHHYLIADTAIGVPVAELVLEHLFTTRQGVMAL